MDSWGAPLIGFVGVVVGAVIALVGQLTVSRHQQRQAIRRDRTDAAVGFLAAADTLTDAMREIQRLLNPSNSRPQSLIDSAHDRYVRAWEVWVEGRARLRVSAPAELLGPGGELRGAVEAAAGALDTWLEEPDSKPASNSFVRTHGKIGDARETFAEGARAVVGHVGSAV